MILYNKVNLIYIYGLMQISDEVVRDKTIDNDKKKIRYRLKYW